ncbi:MAG: hypothetical protein IJB90_01630 [Clostridia bacterium]|nr:hypothetical protein [Clostridia bacterium]
MRLNKEKGITLIALIITVILMLILVGVGIDYGSDSINKAKLEDIKTDMISIKTRAKIVVEQYNFKDIDALVGSEITDAEKDILNIDEKIEGLEEDEYEILKWSSQDLAGQNLSAIEEEKYVVLYNLKDPNECEVYYLDGYEGNYSLSELQDL